MISDSSRVYSSLVGRQPTLSGEEIVAQLVPPRQFETATLDSYRPDRDYPSQGTAVAAVRNFLHAESSKKGGLFRKKAQRPCPAFTSTVDSVLVKPTFLRRSGTGRAVASTSAPLLSTPRWSEHWGMRRPCS